MKVEPLLEAIDKQLQAYFPETWSTDQIAFWLGKSQFSVDQKALYENLNRPAADFVMRGGKRWRPVFFLTSLELFGLDWRECVDIAAAIEIAHNGTLIIDDVEDGATLRRGKPVCHELFGVDVALNAGNAMYFMALQILHKHVYATEEQRYAVAKVYADEMMNVHAGQAIDIFWHNHPSAVSVEQYLEMCRLKTGSLIRMASRMACVLARKDAVFEQAFSTFSDLAGIAFQIKDDALEFTADHKEFGKSFGNDIAEGKMSLPVIFALEMLPEDKKTRLLEILAMHTKEPELLKEAMDVITGSGAIGKATQYANDLIDKAWQAIEPHLASSGEKALEGFRAMTYFSVTRAK